MSVPIESKERPMAMPLCARPTTLDGLWQIDYKVIADQRGSVMEFYRQSEFEAAGLPSLGRRPQTNAPLTVRGGLRGVHAEAAHKYVGVASGRVFAAIVDLRRDSPTAGHHQTFVLERGDGLFISSGLGNSFQTISAAPSTYLYLFEQEWSPDMPGVACDPLDPHLGINWPIRDGEGMIISAKDRGNPSLRQVMGR